MIYAPGNLKRIQALSKTTGLADYVRCVGTEVELHESVSEKSDPLLLAQERRKAGGRKKTYLHLA